MDPLNYSIEDFLCDTTFLSYCLGTNPEHTQLWEKWLMENPEKRVMAEHAKKVYADLNGHHTAQLFQADYKAFQEIFTAHLQQHQPQVKSGMAMSRKLWLSYISAVAAVIALCLFIFWFNLPPSTRPALVNTVAKGQKKTVTLPDGTRVTLNGDSKLRVSNNYNQQQRNVELEGEGYFNVAHDRAKPFIIHTRLISLKVLGTVFNMKAYPHDRTVETTLISGSVEISLNRDPEKKIKLLPNKKFVLSDRTAYKIVDLPFTGNKAIVQEIDWTKNKLSFQQQTLENIIPEIERWYGVEITIRNSSFGQNTYTASFDNEPLDQVLSSLQLTGGFKYRKEDNGNIIIY